MIETNITFQLLEIEEDGCHIVAPFFVNGKEHFFIVDTGASRTVLDRFTFEDEIEEFTEIPTDEIKSAAVNEGEISSAWGKVQQFETGDVKLVDEKFMFIDLRHVNELYEGLTGVHVSGLLGGDFLRRFKACINYAENSISLRQI